MAARIIPTPAMTMDVESLITRLSSGAAAVVASSSNEQLLSMLALSRRQRKPLMTGVDGTSLKLSTSSETQRQSQQLGSAAVGSSAQSSYGSARSPQPLVVVHSGQNKRTTVQLSALLDILRSDGAAPEHRPASSVPPNILRALQMVRSQNQDNLRADLRQADTAFKWAPPDISGITARTAAAPINPAVLLPDASSSVSDVAGLKASAARPRVSAMRGLAATAAGMLEAALPGRRTQHPKPDPYASPWSSSSASIQAAERENGLFRDDGSDDSGRNGGSRDSGSSLGSSQAAGAKEPIAGVKEPIGRYRYLRSAARGAIRQRALWVMEEEAMSLPLDHPDRQAARKVSHTPPFLSTLPSCISSNAITTLLFVPPAEDEPLACAAHHSSVQHLEGCVSGPGGVRTAP